jgi:hypothetical protein
MYRALAGHRPDAAGATALERYRLSTPTIRPVDPLHSRLFDGLGAVASIGFAGFVGGYFGSFLWLLFTDRWIEPLEAGEHMSAWVGLIGEPQSLCTSR